jgi:hypothetical protein
MLRKRMSVIDNFDIISLVHKKLKQRIEAYMTTILQSPTTRNCKISKIHGTGK